MAKSKDGVVIPITHRARAINYGMPKTEALEKYERFTGPQRRRMKHKEGSRSIRMARLAAERRIERVRLGRIKSKLLGGGYDGQRNPKQ